MYSLSNNSKFILSLFGVYSVLGSVILLFIFQMSVYDIIEMLTFISFSIIVGGAFSFITMILLAIKYKHNNYHP